MIASISPKSPWLAAVVLASLAAAARADDRPPVSQLDPAWQRLTMSNARFLDKDQQVLLDDLSFAAAAAEVCPGFVLDKTAFKEGFAGFDSPRYQTLDADKKRRWELTLMTNFGAGTALYAAEALLHPDDACRYAEGKRGDTGPGRFWTRPPAPAPATP